MDFQRCTRPLLWVFAVGVAGCDPVSPVPQERGQALFQIQPARRVQYSASQVKAVYLTLTASGGRNYSYTYSPLTLNGSFPFSVLNLPVGAYSATLSVFKDTATSSATLIGSTATDSFSITQGTTRKVVFPAIALTATPTASWPVAVTVNLVSSGATFTSASADLSEASGRQASGPSWTTLSKTFTWKNLQAFPVGLSTTSVTVTGTRQSKAVKKTAVATISLVPGDNATASLAISL